ncbi:unnamed protein product, partial [Closterium sp. NIES-53]
VFQRPSAPAGGGQAEPNLTVRRVSDGEVVWRQVQKTFNSAAWWVGGGRDMDGGGYAWGGYGEGAVGLGERLGGGVAADAEDFQLCRMVGGGWMVRKGVDGPSMQFSADESVACRPVNGEVQLFTGADLVAGVAARLKVPGMTSAQLAPSPPSHIAVFAPEAKPQPACASSRVTRAPLRPLPPPASPLPCQDEVSSGVAGVEWTGGESTQHYVHSLPTPSHRPSPLRHPCCREHQPVCGSPLVTAPLLPPPPLLRINLHEGCSAFCPLSPVPHSPLPFPPLREPQPVCASSLVTAPPLPPPPPPHLPPHRPPP